MASQPLFGFTSLPNPNFLRESIAFVKRYRHVGILKNDGLWTLAYGVKGKEGQILGFLRSDCLINLALQTFHLKKLNKDNVVFANKNTRYFFNYLFLVSNYGVI